MAKFRGTIDNNTFYFVDVNWKNGYIVVNNIAYEFTIEENNNYIPMKNNPSSDIFSDMKKLKHLLKEKNNLLYFDGKVFSYYITNKKEVK